jgi:diacylglycerol O-acyltransferase
MTASVLSPLDAAFLRLESPTSPLHIASLSVFEGPCPGLDAVRTHVGSKLDRLPRYRQRVCDGPLWLGRPMWVDDAEFDLERHVQGCAVPAPGRESDVRALCARLLERHLDRDAPLWETWVVEGLPEGRWGLLSKVHHCMVDGIAGTDLLAQALELSPTPARVEPAAPWSAAPEPGLARRAFAGLPLPRSGTALVHALRHPLEATRAAATDVHGLGQWLAAVRPVTRTPLLGPVGKQREWQWADVSLTEVREVGRALEGTINDVAEALVCSALRDLLLSRGLEPDRAGVRSLVPVSVRGHGSGGSTALDANRVSAMLATLPVDVADPLARFQAVRAELRRLKGSGQAQAGELLTTTAGLVPPLLLSTGLFGGFRLPHRNLTTVTTNVPGPPVPLYALGRRLLELHPFVPIADRLRLGFAMTSYDDRLWFGITVDRAHVPDADVLVRGLGAALAELRAAARRGARPAPASGTFDPAGPDQREAPSGA